MIIDRGSKIFHSENILHKIPSNEQNTIQSLMVMGLIIVNF